MSGRPGGFVVLAVLLAFYVLGGVGDLVAEPPFAADGPWIFVFLRLASLVLAAVCVEALWKVRPWATRAVTALAAVALAAMAIPLLARGAFGPQALMPVVMAGAVLWLIVRYVDSHVRALHGPTVVLTRRRVPPRP